MSEGGSESSAARLSRCKAPDGCPASLRSPSSSPASESSLRLADTRRGARGGPQAIPRRQWLLYLLLAALAGGSAGFSAVELRAGGSGWLLVASLAALGLVVL